MQIGKKHQLTWMEASACMLLVVALAAALLPAQNRAREVAMRIRCASNLREIGQAMQLYANNETKNGQSYPRALYELKNADKPAAFTNWKQPHSFGDGAPEANDVTSAMYLILKTQELSPLALHCPDSKAKAFVFDDTPPQERAARGADGKAPEVLAKSRTDLSNFPGIAYMSYSMQNPYPSQNALASGWRWNVTRGADFALMADLNPGGDAVLKAKPDWPRKQMHDANSPNHDGEGQNVLYGDGHVEWQPTPFAGPLREAGGTKFRDNIYAADDAKTIMAPSQDRDDNVLLPAADYKAPEK